VEVQQSKNIKLIVKMIFFDVSNFQLLEFKKIINENNAIINENNAIINKNNSIISDLKNQASVS